MSKLANRPAKNRVIGSPMNTQETAPGNAPALFDLLEGSKTHSEVYSKVFSKMTGKPATDFLPNPGDAFALAQLDLAFENLEKLDALLMEVADLTIFDILHIDQTAIAQAIFDESGRTLDEQAKNKEQEFERYASIAEKAEAKKLKVFEILSGTLYQTEATTKEEALKKFEVWFNNEACETCTDTCKCVFEVEPLTTTLD